MEHRFLDKINQRREALNIHNPVQVERSDTQLGVGKTTAYCLLLLLLLLYPAVLSAQTGNGVTVENLVVNTGSPSTVTFDVSWKNTGMPPAWSDTVWVFVDHNDNGKMKRLELLSSGATLTEIYAGAGRVEQLAGNIKGVRVIGDARISGSFSATVQLLTATADLRGMCAYASNYPPVAEYATASSITFTGTPPFDLKLSTGNVSVETGYELSGGQTLVSFTDKTGAPGIIKCIPPATHNLIASASGFCEDDATGITFALDGTQTGVKYQLYRGSDKVGSELTGTGSGAATFTTGGPLKVAGVYTAQSVAESGYCAMLMTGSHNIVAYSAISPGSITTTTATTNAGTAPSVSTITNAGDASGGSGNLTYIWLRTNTGTGSSETVTSGSNATDYTMISSDYEAAGTYYFNRYAKDATCTGYAAVAAYGTYTLGVVLAGTDQPQGGCTFTQPPVLTTFANFSTTYSASSFVTLTDERDYKNYTVVKIGDRWIMAQNLNYQGVANTSSSLTWQPNSNSPSTDTGSNTELIGHFWCPGTITSTSSNQASCDVWGALYSWETAMMVDGKWSNDSRNTTTWVEPAHSTYTSEANTNNGGRGAGNHGICPPNWHVPTDGEWGEVLNEMETGSKDHNSGTGNEIGTDAGSRGKSKCTCAKKDKCDNDADASWKYYDFNTGVDYYGFRALPTGMRAPDQFLDMKAAAYTWSSSASSPIGAWYRAYVYYEASVRRDRTQRSSGCAVRCILDL
jgi:uncharacterized protein (TIGR02145 family)